MSDDTVIRFLFDVKTVGQRLKWKDIKKIKKFSRLKAQGDDVSDEFLEQIQVLACRFMANENDEILPLEQAWKIFDELSQDEAVDAINKFSAVFQEATIPNEIGRPSNTTSLASSQTLTDSPTGSTP